MELYHQRRRVDRSGAGQSIIGINKQFLTKTGITNTGTHGSVITGNIGASPITGAAMSNVFCSEITGKIYGVDAAYTGSGATTCFAGNPGVPAVAPPDANKTLVDNAVADMGTAYTEAAGRTAIDVVNELGAGLIGGMTLAPGLYKWSTNVLISTNVTLTGGANDVWIFQVAGNLDIAAGASVPAGIKVILAGGAKPSNIFWQVGGVTGATLGTFSTFNGTILSAKQVILRTGAVLNGRALAQTQAVLDANPVTLPAP
jgi:Ice-binding-like